MLACPSCGSVYSRTQEFCGLDGSRLVQVSEDPLIGRSIERYTIDHALGSGGMARVYRARHKVLDRQVAIKILYGELASDIQLARRFAREARSLSRIRHQHVVEVLDFGRTQAGLLYMIMELVEGETLSSAIRSGSVSPAESARITREIAMGLEAAHGSGYVHRDLKPQNVVLDDRTQPPTVKILDFGLVGLVEGTPGETPLTRQGSFFGTPTYMSPEQSAGENATPASDMYALGVVLYELLTGKPPFSGEIRQLAHQHLHKQPARPANTHPGLTELALQLLAKVPSRRPTSHDLQVRLASLNIEGFGAPAPSIPVSGHQTPISQGSYPSMESQSSGARSRAGQTPYPPTHGGPEEWDPNVQPASSRPLTVAVPIEHDEFSVLDGSSSHIYEQKSGSSPVRFVLTMLFLCALGGGVYAFVNSPGILPAPAPVVNSEVTPVPPDAKVTDNPSETAKVGEPDENEADDKSPVQRRRRRPRTDAPDSRGQQYGSRSPSRDQKLRQPAPHVDDIEPEVPAEWAIAKKGSRNAKSGKSLLMHDEFLIMHDALRASISRAGMSWNELRSANPRVARKWRKWVDAQRRVPLAQAKAARSALETTIQQMSGNIQPSLLQSKVIEARGLLDTLSASIDQELRSDFTGRLEALETLSRSPANDEDANAYLVSLNKLVSDIKKADINAKKAASEAKSGGPKLDLVEEFETDDAINKKLDSVDQLIRNLKNSGSSTTS